MTTDAADWVLQFLRARPGREYCHTCLATVANIPFEDVQKAVTGLRAMQALKVAVGRCGSCRRSRVTVQSERAAAG